MSAVAKNLEAIDKALEQHARNCGDKVLEIRMNPHEIKRLDWDVYKDIPIVGDPKLGTGMFRLICEGMSPPTEEDEVTEAVSSDREVLI